MKHTLAHPPRQTSSVFSRRVVSTLLAYASLCAVAVLPTQVQADTYPSKPITLVVPNPPGGLLDTSARLLSDPLSRAVGQSVVVDNKPGGSGRLTRWWHAAPKTVTRCWCLTRATTLPTRS